MRDDNQKRFYLRSVLLGILYGLGLALIFAGGFIMRDLINAPSFNNTPSSTGDYVLLNEVQHLLDLHYLREQPDVTQRQYDAIRGMLSGLNDRATFFIEPPVARSESDVLAGTYGGIGVNVQRDMNGQFALYPFDESPAQLAGVEEGDILIAVNGQTIDSQTQQDIIDQLMRGEVKEGNGVELVISRLDETLTFFILFDVINIPSVQWRLVSNEADNIGYIQILRFTSRTPDEMKTALDSLQEQGIKAIILDLRNNYGGLLHESIEVAGLFLDGDVVLYEVRKSGERAFNADEGLYTTLPLAVLVNGGTASASELLAGALQDANRAILIGQTTYGKGTIQQIYQLSDSSSIHITSAEWLTPSRRHIDAIGLTPDRITEIDASRDTEIEEAIQYLQGLLENGE